MEIKDKTLHIYYRNSQGEQVPVCCADCKYRPVPNEEYFEAETLSDRMGHLHFPKGSKCPCQCEDEYYSWLPQDDWFCANFALKEDK